MSLINRAFRGVREHLRTQLAAVVTVSLALFCLGGIALVLENIGALADRWGAPVRMTVYLSDGANVEQVEALRSSLADLPGVADTRYVSSVEARAGLARHGDPTLANAPLDLFPATIELRLVSQGLDAKRIQIVGERVRRLPAVTDVETYRGLTEQVRGLLASGRTAVLAVFFLVVACATAVVGNTVRLSLHARRSEVEVLRLVGASPRYVRAPFLVEGAMLGGGAASLALAIMGVAFLWLRHRFDGSFLQVLGLHPVFLSWPVIALFIAGGGFLGATGSAVALRRWLRI